MTQFVSRSVGVLCLVCGIIFAVQAASRLRADPPLGGCPDKDLSQGTKDCAVSVDCENEVTKAACLKEDVHFVVKEFPKDCLFTKKDRFCGEFNDLCKLYLPCYWDPDNESQPCATDTLAIGPFKKENALKLDPGDCVKAP